MSSSSSDSDSCSTSRGSTGSVRPPRARLIVMPSNTRSMHASIEFFSLRTSSSVRMSPTTGSQSSHSRPRSTTSTLYAPKRMYVSGSMRVVVTRYVVGDPPLVSLRRFSPNAYSCFCGDASPSGALLLRLLTLEGCMIQACSVSG